MCVLPSSPLARSKNSSLTSASFWAGPTSSCKSAAACVSLCSVRLKEDQTLGSNEEVLTAQEQEVTFLGACENIYSFFREEHDCICMTASLYFACYTHNNNCVQTLSGLWTDTCLVARIHTAILAKQLTCGNEALRWRHQLPPRWLQHHSTPRRSARAAEVRRCHFKGSCD